MIKKSILAGVMIAIASFCYCNCAIKEVGMLLFCGGLFVVCKYGLNLYTGKVGYIGDKMNSHLVPGLDKWDVVELASMLFLNIVAAYLTGFLFGFNGENTMAGNIVYGFDNLGYFPALIKAIGCGACMYLAVDIYKKGSILGILLFVPIFLASGFLHSIALPAFYGINGTIPPVGKLMVVAFGNGIGAMIVNKMAK